MSHCFILPCLILTPVAPIYSSDGEHTGHNLVQTGAEFIDVIIHDKELSQIFLVSAWLAEMVLYWVYLKVGLSQMAYLGFCVWPISDLLRF